MDSMFANSSAEKLDLTSFNTEKVIDMKDMFGNGYTVSTAGDGALAKEIDLSSFDFRSLLRSERMFYGAKAEKIYVKSEKELTRLINTYSVPQTAKLIVK